MSTLNAAKTWNTGGGGSIQGRTEYFFGKGAEVEKYLSEDGRAEGRYVGRLAEKLGIAGQVPTPETFSRLLNGQDPRTGEFLGEREKERRRTDKPFVSAPPKSFSIMASLTTDEKLRASMLAATDEANLAALRVFEAAACVRDRSPGEKKQARNARRVTRNLVSVIFRHGTSRPVAGGAPDPYIHHHNQLLNLTEDPATGRIMALEDSLILERQKEALAAYDASLAAFCVRNNIRIEGDGKRGFILSDVDPRAVELYSQRRAEIVAATKLKMAELAAGGKSANQHDVAEIVAHSIRQDKAVGGTIEELRNAWRVAAKAAGIREDGLRADTKPVSGQNQTRPLTVKKAVEFAISHLTEREAVIKESALVTEAVGKTLGSGATPEQVHKEIARLVKSKSLLRAGDSYTTPEALRDEQRLLTGAKNGVGKVKPIMRHYQPDPRLSAEQADAARLILTGCDRTSIIRGPAGTGKSNLLAVIVSEAEGAGQTVLVAAPMGRQARGLQADGFTQAQTVAKMLHCTIPKGATVIVDESGQVGVADLNRIQDAVTRAGGRLILSGDARQHGSVPRGDALRHLERDSGITRAELTTIRRQDASRGRTPDEQKSIATYRDAAKLSSQGKAVASYDKMDALGAIKQVSDPIAAAAKIAQEKSRDGSVLVVAGTRRAVAELNQSIRAARLKDGQVAKNGQKITTFALIDTSETERKDILTYRPGTLISFSQKHGDLVKGSVHQVAGIDEKKKQLILTGEAGKTHRVGLGAASKWQLVEKKDLEISAGDQLLLRQNASLSRGGAVANGEIVGVKSVENSGEITLDDGRILPKTYRQITHGYSTTNYSGQGKTAENVIIVDDGAKGSTSSRAWYVGLTRGRRSATILTSDKAGMRIGIAKSGDSKLASDHDWERQPSAREKLAAMAKSAGSQVFDAALNALRKSGLSPLLAGLQSSKKSNSQTRAQQISIDKSKTILPKIPDFSRKIEQLKPQRQQPKRREIDLER